MSWNTWNTLPGSEYWIILFKHWELIEKQHLNGMLTELKKKNLIVGMQEYTVNAQYTKYMNHPEKTLKEDFATSQGGTFRIESTQIKCSWDSQTRAWTLWEATKGTQIWANSRGGCKARFHSDQMVLVMARQEAGPCERWTGDAQGRVGKKLQKAKGPSQKQAQCQPKKGWTYSFSGWDGEGRWCCWWWWCDENQCVTRLSDSDTVYGGIIPQDSVSIALSTFQTSQKWRRGVIQTDNMTHLVVLAGFHTSHLNVQVIYRVSDKWGFSFHRIILWLGKTIKLILLFPPIQKPLYSVSYNIFKRIC
jgi:hypothetical protein